MAITRPITSVHEGRRSSRRTAEFDFRRPSKLGRDVLQVIELGHETFTRRLSTGWGSELRSVLQIEPLAIDQTSYDDYIRSMPNPNVAITVSVPPLPGTLVVDCNVQLALQMVERLLGAAPTPGVAPPRRPSEVEADLILFLGRQVAAAVTETLRPLLGVEVDAQLEGVEFNPQLVQVAAPSDTALLLSYGVAVSGGFDASGFLTVAYPGPVLNPMIELIEARRGGDEHQAGNSQAHAVVAAALADVGLALSLQLNTSPIPASDVAGLQVGDVLRLDHRVDAPARGVVGGEDVLLAHLGRRGQRLAVQVREWLVSPSQVLTVPEADDQSGPRAQVEPFATDRQTDPHSFADPVPTEMHR